MWAKQKSLFIPSLPSCILDSSTSGPGRQGQSGSSRKVDDLSPGTHILAYTSPTGSNPATSSSPLCVPSIVVAVPGSSLSHENEGDVGMVSKPSSTPPAHIPTTTWQISLDTSCMEWRMNDFHLVILVDRLGVDKM